MKLFAKPHINSWKSRRFVQKTLVRKIHKIRWIFILSRNQSATNSNIGLY